MNATTQRKMETLQISVEPSGAYIVDGLMSNSSSVGGASASAAPSIAPKRSKNSDPFPQALDGSPDHAAWYAQVPDDSKPKLAEMVGALAMPPPMLSFR